MSDDATHGATTVRASKGGGMGKWLIGAAAAAIVLGGGYFAWKSMTPDQGGSEIAYNDPYAAAPEPPLDLSDSPTADGTGAEIAAPAETPAPAPARRSTARRTPVPETTIGVTPASATTESATGEDDIVVTAPRAPVWASTPSPRRLSALYPTRALERGREGEARLACVVQERGALDCDRLSETRTEFGAAALRVARSFRHATTLADGSDAVGTPVNLRVVFRIDENERRFASR